MKKIITVLLISMLLLSNISYAAPPEVSAKSAIVMDVSSGRVLYSKNINQKLPMASTTKITTAIVALESGNLTDVIKTSPRAAHVEGSSIWLEENETITMENAIYGLMLSSGNDAAIAIAEHIGGSVEKFAEMMTETVKRIGAQNTNYKNPNGLDAQDHYTTAYDLALITRYGLKNAKFAEIVKTKEKKIPWQDHEWNRMLKNHNKLLWKYQYADGVKTGFTKKSGRCLVSSATKDGWQVVAVTLNDGDDWNDHIKMFEYAFDTYKPKKIIEENQYVKTIAVKNGERDKVSLVTSNAIQVPMLQSEEDKIRIDYKVPDFLTAPVQHSNDIGSIQIYIQDEFVGNVPLKTTEYIEKLDVLQDMQKLLKNWLLIFNNGETLVR